MTDHSEFDEVISEGHGTASDEETGAGRESAAVEDVSEEKPKEKEVLLVKMSPDILPKDVVHCFPARKSVIAFRRAVTIPLFFIFLAGAVYFLLPDSRSIALAFFAAAGSTVSLLVFIQSFLIASYRVALDYGQKAVTLRYKFQIIRISFSDFDTREGKPDRAESLLSSSSLNRNKKPVRYLILDNVRDSACYQTTSKDLASEEDFNRLKTEAENIRDVFRGKPAEEKVVVDEDEMDKIIHSALADTSKKH